LVKWRLLLGLNVKLRTSIEWASSSALGHIASIGSIFSFVEIAAFLIPDYLDGTLTLARALYLVVVFVSLGVAVALLTWYTVTLPLIKRRKSRF